MSQRLVGVEDAGCQHEVAHERRPADLEQPGGAAGVGDQPVGQLGEAELGVVGRDPDIAQQRPFPHPADAPALDRTDDRHPGRDEEALGLAVTEGDVPVVALALAPVAELAHVAPGRERATLGAPEHAVDVVALLELLERRPEPRFHVIAHGVQLVGAVQREHRQVPVVLDPHVAVGHGGNLGQPAPPIARSTSP